MHTVNMSGVSREPIDDKTYTDHWGVKREISGRYWDHDIVHPLEGLSNLDNYKFPEFNYDQVDPETSIEYLKAGTRKMVETFQRLMPHGGFMIKHYYQPWDIDLSEEKELAIVDAFFEAANIEHLGVFQIPCMR